MKMLRFIHIPKTGGTSVRKYLLDNNIQFYSGQEPKQIGRHRPASVWKDEESYKFAVVRDPYTRTVSYYNYYTDKDWNPTFEDFVKNKMVNKSLKVPNVWIPQVSWLYENNICLVDKIFKLEDNLQDNLNIFLNIKGNLTKENISTHNSYDSYYTQELKDLIASYFKEDFEKLGYSI